MTTITETRVLARIDKWSVVIFDRFACLAAVNLIYDVKQSRFKTKAIGNKGGERTQKKSIKTSCFYRLK